MGTHFVGVALNEYAQEMGGGLMPHFVKTASRSGINFIPSNILSPAVPNVSAKLADVPYLSTKLPAVPHVSIKLATAPYVSSRKYSASTGGGYASAPIMLHTVGALIGDSIKSLDAQLYKAVKGFSIAKGWGVHTPIAVLPGPVSRLLLLSEHAKDFGEPFPGLLCLLNKFLPSYKEAVAKLKAAGASCIQFDEPMLVKDLESHELQAVTKAYSEMERSLAGLDVLIQTYNGNVTTAVFKTLIALGVSAIGFDLVHGSEIIDLVNSGFPSNKYLFAGVVDVKNIHPNDHAAPLNTLHSIKGAVGKGKLVVSTSGPLVFDAVNNVEDPGLVKDIESSWLEFAAQKVSEVKTVANLFSAGHEDEIMCSFGGIQEPRNADRNQKIKLFGFDQSLQDTAKEQEAHGDGLGKLEEQLKYAIAEIQELIHADRELKKENLQFHQILGDISVETEAHRDRLNIVEEQTSRAMGMNAGYNARQKARRCRWLRCSCFQ